MTITEVKTIKPHCPRCFYVIEKLAVWQPENCKLWIVYCPNCGCTIGVCPPFELPEGSITVIK